jgi:lipopolysaccharide biosynthesis regulator YciM
MAGEDGNTKHADEVAALARKVEEQKAALEKALKRVDDAQDMISRQAADKGEDSKAIREDAATIRRLGQEVIDANAELKKTREILEQAQRELADVKTKLGLKADEGATQKEAEKTADEIEVELTKEEQAKLDEAWKDATEAVRSKIKSDPNVRKQFLLMAKQIAKQEADSDLSSWRNTPAPRTSETPSGGGLELDKLFKQKKTSAEYTPDGPGSGSPRARQARRPAQGERTASWVSE